MSGLYKAQKAGHTLSFIGHNGQVVQITAPSLLVLVAKKTGRVRHTNASDRSSYKEWKGKNVKRRQKPDQPIKDHLSYVYTWCPLSI